ncbi:MAG: amino acid permease [Lentisphaeria bacterium]|nr:amino acid permease [Lentisphaeria bacterium]
MISSGLFVLPGIAYAEIGPASFLAYLLASILVIPAMLSKAELATAMPKAGGTYFFIDRSMGPGFGTLAGLSSWFALSFKSAFALLGIGAFAVLVFPHLTIWQTKLIAAAFCILFGTLNIFSIKHAGHTQILLVLGLLALLFVYIMLGIPAVKVENLTPFLCGSPRVFIATAGLIFISYGGLTKIANVAGEVRNPARNVPASMLASFLIVSIIYGLAVFVTVGVVGQDLMKEGVPSLTPLSDAAARVLGTPGKIVMAVAALLAFVSTGNAGIMTASRSPLAMSKDKLLPAYFGKVHPTYGTPRNAIVVTTFFMLGVILFLDLKMLVKTASTLMILLFASVNIAVVLMRESRILAYQPKFRCPGYPWMQGIGVVAYGVMLFEMGAAPLMITAAFLAFGLLWYWVYGRINSNRVSALIHLVRRITAREMQYDILNSELKEILLERDDIIEDRFDVLVKNADVIDERGDVLFEELFRRIAAVLAEHTEVTEKRAYEFLLERERDSSTVLAPGLAIPHLIIPGDHHFRLLLVRCRTGVHFSSSEVPVEALFVLAGTADERNFHLKALMSIAQVVQQDRFLEKWRNASEAEGLRDFVLLSERPRQ